jgi:hypothetical protein
MDPDANTSAYFRNYEAQQKYAPFFSNQTQLDLFLRLPVAGRDRDELLVNLHKEYQHDKNKQQLDEIDDAIGNFSFLDGIDEGSEDAIPVTPSSDPVSER